ncbi:baseplate J/gp47 family protein [Ideonella sp. 4Y16]|uniref:baseplate J/gp47 family protein n=1 Tax=Ideonella alba TaxID=2824118 RepID=UPI001B3642E9|nr:baseplate J/gp47 family protein [Ideonella alba]MBQ0946126.1 baseplate J/gp47 family protein [Ideonella alba]
MALDDLLRRSAAQGGQSQADRDRPAADPAHAPLDPRDAATLMQQARTLAAHIALPAPDGGDEGRWSALFPDLDRTAWQQLADARDGQVPPHLALWLALARLQQASRERFNALGAAHLDWQLRTALGFAPEPAHPDHAHLRLTLKKGALAQLCDTTRVFSAGPDAQGVERLYRPLRDTPIGPAQVRSLQGLQRDGGRLRFAPRADSADGLGAPLAAGAPGWAPGGGPAAPEAPVGFAITSPMLALAEGRREIRLDLELIGSSAATPAEVAAGLQAWLSGPKGWIGPLQPQVSAHGSGWRLVLVLSPDQPAVVAHQQALHLSAFPDGTPVLQLLLAPGVELRPGLSPWAALEGLRLQAATLQVEVQGLRGLALENDHGALDPKKVFMPFGAQPVPGSRLRIGCPEALAKPLQSLSLTLDWHGAPASLSSWYAGYQERSRIADGVAARLRYTDGRGHSTDAPVTLRPSPLLPSVLHNEPPVPVFPLRLDWPLQRLLQSGSGQARLQAERAMQAQPVRRLQLHLRGQSPAVPAGQIALELDGEDFLHTAHRQQAVAHLLSQIRDPDAPPVQPLNEPYTPQLRGLSLDYTAASARCALDQADEASLSGADLAFYQVDAFGPVREHAWLRATLPWAPQGAPGLLPAHPHALELCIGLDALAPGDAVSLLCQVEDGSADPEAPSPRIAWSVLCDTQWRPLGAAELALDTTAHLRRSGLVQLTLPPETSREHTRQASGLVWLRACWLTPAGSAARLRLVASNGVEVRADAAPHDPARFALPLPAGSIGKLVTPMAAVQGVAQPFESFGGQAPETPAALRRRAAERLRHRGRAITPWDVERLVLQAFPGLHRVQCIPHARPGGHWQAPGHRLVVVVPDLRQRHTADPLQPRADLDTLQSVQAFLEARSAPGTRTHVVNPRCRVLQVRCRVKLRPGVVFSLYRPQIDAALQRALSPWLADAARQPGFGGAVWRSALLDLVEELPGVDYLSRFSLHMDGGEDLAEAVADTPDSILVSAPGHLIDEETGDV